MPWTKGVSGNPSGRRHARDTKKTVTEIAREYAPEAVRALVKVMRSPKSTPTAIAIAADRILDRAWGKAPQLSLVSLEAPSRRAAELSDDELAAIAASALPAPDVIDAEAIVVEEENGHDISVGKARGTLSDRS